MKDGYEQLETELAAGFEMFRRRLDECARLRLAVNLAIKHADFSQCPGIEEEIENLVSKSAKNTENPT